MPIEVLPGMFDESNSPSEQWKKLREEYRKANHQRVRRSLSKYSAKNEKGDVVETPFSVNDERHSMDEIDDSEFTMTVTPLEIAGLSRSLAKQSRETIIHDQMQVPEDSGLPYEDLDGPPIHDLSDEDEILRAMDMMRNRVNRSEDN